MENQVLDSDLTINKKAEEYDNLHLKPNEQRAKAVLVLIWIVLGLEILAIISSGLQYNLLQTVAQDGDISTEAATANDLREQIIAVLYLVAFIASGIAFIMWFRRAYYNLHQLVKGLSYTDGWAAGCWFVPLINLFRPYQIMKEIYLETKKYIVNKNESSRVNLDTNFLGIWWTLWIISGIFGQIIFRLSNSAETIPELLTITSLSIISEVVGILLAFVTIKVIKDYSKIEGSLSSNG